MGGGGCGGGGGEREDWHRSEVCWYMPSKSPHDILNDVTEVQSPAMSWQVPYRYQKVQRCDQAASSVGRELGASKFLQSTNISLAFCFESHFR